MASSPWYGFRNWSTVAAGGLITAALGLALVSAGCAGPQGDAGPAGSPGQTGPAGPAGAKGDAGATGPSGDRGPSGITGPAGEAGAQGPAAPQPQARITTSTSTVTLDEAFEVWGSGFAAGESVVIAIAIDEFIQQVVGDTTASAGGSFRIAISNVGGDERVRARVTDGQIYSLLAQGTEGTLASTPLSLILEREVVIPTPTPAPTPIPTPVPEPSEPPSPTLVAGIAVSGEVSTFWAAGFAPGESVVLGILNGSEILVAREANDSGAVLLETRIELDPGIYTVVATGSLGGRAVWPLIVVNAK